MSSYLWAIFFIFFFFIFFYYLFLYTLGQVTYFDHFLIKTQTLRHILTVQCAREPINTEKVLQSV